MSKSKKSKYFRTTMIVLLSLAFAFAISACIFLNQSSFGRKPSGERLDRIRKSANYSDDKFHNETPTELLTSSKPKIMNFIGFLFRSSDGLRPDGEVPCQRIDLKALDRNEDTWVWLGHSSSYLQLCGIRFLIDPVFVMASPVSFFNKPFSGADSFSPNDIPDIDYLLITHDHWDHLDFNTIDALKDRIGAVVCPLGVGEHFEYWGFPADRIIELDWRDSVSLNGGIELHCLPSRHFSGRGLTGNTTLWSSFLLRSTFGNIFFSGDGGYGRHFAEIGARFGSIDFAVMENGQYNQDWRNIHLMPEDLPLAVRDIRAKRVVTVHNSKYALAKHYWKEPLETAATNAQANHIQLLTPMIGEPVRLADTNQQFGRWWESIH